MAPSGVLAGVLPSGQQPNSVLSQDERSSAVARVGVDKVGPAVAEEESEDEEEEKKKKEITMEKNNRRRNCFLNSVGSHFTETFVIALHRVKQFIVSH